MILIQRHDVAHAEVGQEELKTVRKNVTIVKVAAKRTQNEKVLNQFGKAKEGSHKLALRKEHAAKQVRPLSSFIRIQLEEIKRRVRVLSPAALQFIGPGDQ